MAMTGRAFVTRGEATVTAAAAGPSFTVVQYNILADRAIPKGTGGHDICGTYAYCPAAYRYMESRHPRIIAELLELDGDVICLQEVEASHYYDRLKPDLARHGYNGVVHQRWYDHIGLAIFYRTATFTLEDERSVLLHLAASSSLPESGEADESSPKEQTAAAATAAAAAASRQLPATVCSAVEQYMSAVTTLPEFGLQPPGFLEARLRHKSSGQTVVVGNVHVFWGRMEYHCVQILQIACSVAELRRFAGDDGIPLVLAGDFNAEPGMPAYQFLQRGCLPEETVRALELDSCEKDVTVGGLRLIDVCTRLPRHRPMTSSYASVLGTEPELTSSDDGDMPGKSSRPCCSCLDYVWYDGRSLTATAVLTTPSAEAIAKYYALPSVVHPSDHLSLKTELALTVSSPASR